MRPFTMSNTVAPEVIPVWPGDIPGSELWQDAGLELERPRWENSRLVRNISVARGRQTR